MANVVKVKNRIDGSEPAATSLAGGELGIKQVASSGSTAASGKLYYGEDVGDGSTPDGTTVARAFGIGIKGTSGSQRGVPIGGNLIIAAGSGITTTATQSGDVSTLTIVATGGGGGDEWGDDVDSHIKPASGNSGSYDIGDADQQFRNAHFDGTVEADAITIGDTDIGSIYMPLAGGTFTGDITMANNEDILFATNGGSQIGSTSAGLGHMFFTDAGTIHWGNDQDMSVSYSSVNHLEWRSATDTDLDMWFGPSQQSPHINNWRVRYADNTGIYSMSNYASGAWVTHFQITPNSTVADSTTAIAGHLTVGHDIGSTSSLVDKIFCDDIYVDDVVYHNGDVDTNIAFGSNTMTFDTGGSDRFNISDTGVQFGAAGARVTTINTSFADNDTTLMTSQAIKEKIENYSYLAGITASAAEVNTIDGYTGTTAELNYLDGTKGTITASKAVVADSSGNINGDSNGTLSNYDLSGCGINNSIIGGSTRAAGYFTTVHIESELAHIGDTNNSIAFGTDTQTYETGGTTRMDISNTGVRFGAAGARITSITDDDNLGTSDTLLCTQGNVKAYVDANAGGGSTNAAGSDTHVQFNDGGTSFGGSSNLTWDDTTLSVFGTGQETTFFQVRSTHTTGDVEHDGPRFDLSRYPAVDAVDGIQLGRMRFNGKTDTQSSKTYGSFMCKVVDASATQSAGKFVFQARRNNSLQDIFSAGTIAANDTGSSQEVGVFPEVDSYVNLGTSSLHWKNFYCDANYADAYYGWDGSSWLGGASGSVEGITATAGGQPVQLLLGASNGITTTFGIMQGSDENIKTDIKDVGTGLSLIDNLKPKTFKFRDDFRAAHNLTGESPTEYGYIAQDLQAISSDYVRTVPDPRDENETILAIDQKFERDLKASMVKAIQELSTKNDALEARIAALEA